MKALLRDLGFVNGVGNLVENVLLIIWLKCKVGRLGGVSTRQRRSYRNFKTSAKRFQWSQKCTADNSSSQETARVPFWSKTAHWSSHREGCVAKNVKVRYQALETTSGDTGGLKPKKQLCNSDPDLFVQINSLTLALSHIAERHIYICPIKEIGDQNKTCFNTIFFHVTDSWPINLFMITPDEEELKIMD